MAFLASHIIVSFRYNKEYLKLIVMFNYELNYQFFLVSVHKDPAWYSNPSRCHGDCHVVEVCLTYQPS